MLMGVLVIYIREVAQFLFEVILKDRWDIGDIKCVVGFSVLIPPFLYIFIYVKIEAQNFYLFLGVYVIKFYFSISFSFSNCILSCKCLFIFVFNSMFVFRIQFFREKTLEQK